jgi:hypothetical protein
VLLLERGPADEDLAEDVGEHAVRCDSLAECGRISCVPCAALMLD